MGNSYCEKDYSKVEAKVLEITQIRLQKMKKNVAMASFYCLVCKIWKKIGLYVVTRRQKSAWVMMFLKRKKLT